MKKLILLRGLPGAGKSTVAQMFLRLNYNSEITYREADHFFYDAAGNYNFDMAKLHAAHMACQSAVVGDMMEEIDIIIVSNTSTTEKELKPYLEMAKEYNYQVISLITENRHGNESVHDVPEETMIKMKERFSVKL